MVLTTPCERRWDYGGANPSSPYHDNLRCRCWLLCLASAADQKHFEVADAALAAFCRTQAALIYARNPASFVGEGASRERDNTNSSQSKLLDRLFIPVERLRQHREAFAELERVAFAVEVHFGDHVARQVREPLRAYNLMVVSTALQMEFGSGFRPEGGHKADYDDPDRLSDEIYKAKVAVETALRPHLEAPTLEQFLLLTELRASARRVIAFLVSMGRRLCALS
jgi:hypothetical protein